MMSSPAKLISKAAALASPISNAVPPSMATWTVQQPQGISLFFLLGVPAAFPSVKQQGRQACAAQAIRGGATGRSAFQSGDHEL